MQVTGEVLEGKKYGRTLGFPTVNLRLEEDLASGIYRGAVMVGAERHPAGIYVPAKVNIIEAHILDFEKDLYGQTVTIIVDEKIRDNKNFESEEELREQITKDIDVVRKLWEM